jgi:hypothetical protein
MDEFKVITYRHHYDLHKAITGKVIEASRIVSLHIVSLVCGLQPHISEAMTTSLEGLFSYHYRSL